MCRPTVALLSVVLWLHAAVLFLGYSFVDSDESRLKVAVRLCVNVTIGSHWSTFLCFSDKETKMLAGGIARRVVRSLRTPLSQGRLTMLLAAKSAFTR